MVPPTFFLDPGAVVEVLLARLSTLISGMSPKVRCSEPSMMVERIWMGGGFWVEVWGTTSSEWRHWLIRLGGIVKVVLRLRQCGRQILGVKV
jgi:hypothetical protein